MTPKLASFVTVQAARGVEDHLSARADESRTGRRAAVVVAVFQPRLRHRVRFGKVISVIH